jgi:peptidoglycan/LPS O-acetylase OafA/YrhL
MVFLTKYDRYANIIGASWIAAFYTSLLLLAIVNPGRIVNRLFCNRMLTQLGIVSYAVYIFHQGINDLIHFAIFGMYPSFRTWPTQLVTLLSLGAVFLLAAASWRFIEAPILKRARATFRYFPAREAENSFGTLGEPALVSVSPSEL